MGTERRVEVAIIGAGTAGLSACSEIQKFTDNFVLINGGPHGTTCARVGCMPSKALIQVANDFHRRYVFSREGITGSEELRIDRVKVLQYVRVLRDSFVQGVYKTIDDLGDRNITGYARFCEPTVLRVDDLLIRAKRIVIAAGSSPYIPEAWSRFSEQLLTTDTLFEQSDLTSSLLVLGRGAIGIELSQALARLGVSITNVGRSPFMANLTDPEVNAYLRKVLEQEFTFHEGVITTLDSIGTEMQIRLAENTLQAKKVLVSLGRRANVATLGLDALGVELDEHGLPSYDPSTMQVGDLPIFIAGDVNADRALLHEAADEGRIAGFNSVQEQSHCFQRRARLNIVFSEPNVAIVGAPFAEIQHQDIIIGESRFDSQGRARIMAENKGILRIYGNSEEGRILGGELVAPHGEHLAHLLAWSIQQGLTVFALLQLPFYHPVLEEGLRTALRNLARQVRTKQRHFEIAMCDSAAVADME